MRKKLKYFIGVFGILITVFAWLISNYDRYPILYNFIAPKYLNAQSAYKSLLANGTVSEGDKGFDEIKEVVKRYINSDIEPKITSIRGIQNGTAEVLNREDGRIAFHTFLKIEVTFENHEPLSGEIRQLDSRISELYLNKALISWADILFWVGIVISLISLFL